MKEIRRRFGALEGIVFYPETVETVIYMHAQEEMARSLVELLEGKHAALIAISGEDWNRDLSPWPAQKVFRGGADFAGSAEAHLRRITEEMIPVIEAQMGVQPRRRMIVGYSLAGLFAVYALYRTDAFTDAASVSGSMWYDGFIEFMRENTPQRIPERMYFSLGDREKMTKNTRMARVEDCTEAAAAHFAQLGARVCWEKNPGNHFADGEERMKKAMRFLLERE